MQGQEDASATFLMRALPVRRSPAREVVPVAIKESATGIMGSALVTSTILDWVVKRRNALQMIVTAKLSKASATFQRGSACAPKDTWDLSVKSGRAYQAVSSCRALAMLPLHCVSVKVASLVKRAKRRSVEY